MSNNPVVFMAFANSSTSPLEQLTQEDDDLLEILHDRSVNQQHFYLHRESHLSLDNLRHYLIEYKDRVIMFHYAGHAGSEQLFLQSGEAKSGGIAEMLAEQENLKLVFLNGCSTQKQVEYLLELGVPAVIATSAPIEDVLARKFASYFYQALVKDFTIGEAYEQAASYLRAGGEAEEETNTRGFDISNLPATKKRKLKWGIFTHPDKQEALEEKLPDVSSKEVNIQIQADSINLQSVSVNGYLITTLSEALKPYNKKLRNALENIQEEDEWEEEDDWEDEDWEDEDWEEEETEKVIDTRIIQQAILDSLPAPIAIQIRKLFSFDQNDGKPTEELFQLRLKQLDRSASILIELLVFSILSQLWDAHPEENKDSTSNFVLDDECKTALENYFGQDEAAMKEYDYRQLIVPVLNNLTKAGIPLFMEEWKDLLKLFKPSSKFDNAWTFMHALKQKLVQGNQQLTGKALINSCLEAEANLGELMRPLGFLSRYKLVTVKTISISKSRNRKPIFTHEHVNLDMITIDFKDMTRKYIDHADSQSVIWVKESKRSIGRHLSLSPFIVDWHAWTGYERSKLFLFYYIDTSKQRIQYRFVENASIRLEDEINTNGKDKDIDLKNSAFERMEKELKRQLNDFTELFLGREIVE